MKSKLHPSIGLDLIVVAVSVSIFTLSAKPFATSGFDLAWVFLGASLLFSVFFVLIRPLIGAQRQENSKASRLRPGERITILYKSGYTARALDFVFWKVVILSDYDDRYRDALLEHELAHLRSGDARYFQLASVAFLTVSVQIGALILLTPFLALSQEFAQRTDFPLQTLVGALLVLLLGWLCLLYWSVAALHQREYLADQQAFGTVKTEYLDLLQREADLEAMESLPRPAINRAYAKHLWTRVTHPRFSDRVRAITLTGKRCLFGAKSWFVCGFTLAILMSFITMHSGQLDFYNSEQELRYGALQLANPRVALPVSVAATLVATALVSLLAVSQMRSVTGSRLRDGAYFAALVSLGYSVGVTVLGILVRPDLPLETHVQNPIGIIQFWFRNGVAVLAVYFVNALLLKWDGPLTRRFWGQIVVSSVALASALVVLTATSY